LRPNADLVGAIRAPFPSCCAFMPRSRNSTDKPIKRI
jgi:hypothetical protein